MRLGLKAKEALAITVLTCLVVATATLVHFSQLTRVVLQEAAAQTDLVAKQIYAQSRRALARSRGRDPWGVLRRDGELRGLLEASVGYSPHLLYVQLADAAGRTRLHGERQKEGAMAPEVPPVRQLLSLDPLRRFLALYEPGGIYELRLPLRLDDEPFGSIRLGIATSFFRRELDAAMVRGLALAGLALPVAWLVALALANWTLRPLRRLTQEVERLRRGEFETSPDLGRQNEFQDLAAQLQLLGQQLQSDRLKTLSGQMPADSIKTLQSVVSYSAKLSALGRLTTGVAHEVKNPLNAMMIHVALLKDKLPPTPEDAHESLAVIEGEIRRLDRAVQGFLKFIRPQEVRLNPVDLNALFQHLVALLQAEWQPKGIRFALQPDPRLPPVPADDELLRQAFLNLLLNACQAMPEGGTLTITTTWEPDRAATVTITDQGEGILDEDLDKIFRLYYTTKPDGSGIGLSLVYRIVQLHDGTIDVSSAVGKGTTVRVQLPLRELPSGPADAQEPAAMVRTGQG
jgi:signal transduction histidine kinase